MIFKKHIILILILAVVTFSCMDFETPEPTMSDFKIYELVLDANGNEVTGNELSQVPVGEKVQIEVLTSADIATVWTGDFSYRPWGTSDSLLDSRNYDHYGMLGAEGLTMTPLEGAIGFFRQYTWPEANTYTVHVVLTNHGVADTNFKQIVKEFSVTVVN